MFDEKLENKLRDGRMVAAAEHIIFPQLEKMIADKVQQACNKFLLGETSFIAEVAYIAAIKALADDLKNKQVQGNKAYEKLEKLKE